MECGEPPVTEYVTPRPEWNTGGGDCDLPYRFGRPVSYLSPREHVRLVLLKARVVAMVLSGRN